MQKKLIALAVAGLASSAAFAQSNVTIYGLLQPSYDFMDTDTADNTTEMNWNNSRIGFKGSEALGNGLKAIFQIESKVKLSETGGGTIADRDSWVGLAGGFGSLTFGNHQSAYVKVSASYDPFADSIGDYNNVMGMYGQALDGGAIDGAAYDFNRRISRSAYYTSPNFNGFQVVGSYALDSANAPGNAADDVVSVAASYTNGGLGLMAAYENQGRSAGENDVKGYKLGASYKFSFGTKLSGIYENLSQDIAGGDLDRDAFFLGVVHPITGNVDLMASYINAGESRNNADDGADNWNLGVNYKLSKRTSVQGFYTSIDNDSNGLYFADAGYGNTTGGANVSGFSVRLKHSF